MIKIKHLPLIEKEAKELLKQNVKKYTNKKKRDTFQIRASKTFKPRLKDESIQQRTTMAKILDNILAQKYFRLTPLTEIDYQLKLESQKLERLRKRQKKVNDIAEHLKSLGIIKTI